MLRKEFIRHCGFGCLAVVCGGLIPSGCSPVRSITGEISDDKVLKIPCTAFTNRKENAGFLRYVVVRNPALNYPVVVYRESATEFTALLLRCTHQYAELSVSGELLTCSAHGSEFNSRGEVVQGPATASLRRFTVTTDGEQLLVNLA